MIDLSIRLFMNSTFDDNKSQGTFPKYNKGAWGKRPQWGNWPTHVPACLTTHLRITVSWSGHQHHLSEVLYNYSSLGNWQGRRQDVFFFCSHHLWCKYTVLLIASGSVLMCSVYIRNVDSYNKDWRVTCSTIQTCKYCCWRVSVNVFQYGVWGKSLKSAWNRAGDNWMLTNAGKSVTQSNVAKIFAMTYMKTSTVDKSFR